MELVGLPSRLLYVYPSQLSGGQRQRVAIARALAMKPQIVICDEPTSALDVSVQAQILNLLQDLRRELNLTLVIVSHNLGVVEHMADRVAVMYLGRIIEAGPTAAVFSRPRHPYTQTLLESVLTPDTSRGLPDFVLGPGFPNPLDPPSGCTFHPRCPKAMPDCARVRPATRRDGNSLVECHLYDAAAAIRPSWACAERRRGSRLALDQGEPWAMDVGSQFRDSFEFGALMARNRKGPPHQAKHFQPEDHAHAAHQEAASHAHAQKPGHGTGDEGKSETRRAGHPVESTPRGPSKGQ